MERTLQTRDRGALPSGRTVTLRADGNAEELEIRSASGDLELSIALTEAGPVLRLRGVKLQIDSTDAVALNCREFNVNAAGDVRIKSQGQTHIDAEMINLNCGDRTGYPDEETAKRTAAIGDAAFKKAQAALPQPDNGGCGCDHS